MRDHIFGYGAEANVRERAPECPFLSNEIRRFALRPMRVNRRLSFLRAGVALTRRSDT